MKPLPALLLNVVIAAAAIGIYDTVIRDAPSSETLDPDFDRVEEPGLGPDPLREIADRLQQLEARQQSIEGELSRIRAAFPEPGKVDSTALRDLVPPATSEFDDVTLDALKAHLTELKRRDRQRQFRTITERNLDRLDLRLTDDEREGVIQLALAHRDRMTTFWQDLRDRGVIERKAQLEELAKAKATFRDELAKLVPEQVLERTLDALVGSGSLSRSDGSPRQPSDER